MGRIFLFHHHQHRIVVWLQLFGNLLKPTITPIGAFFYLAWNFGWFVFDFLLFFSAMKEQPVK